MQDKHQQALKEVQDKHQQALKEVQDKHQQALEELNKYRLAVIAEQEKYQQASAEERSSHEKTLADAQNRHQQELRQKERERNEYVARLSTLSVQFTELNNRIEKNDTHLNLMIKELTGALDGKRSEHAKALADLQSSKKVLDEMRGALAASRDVGERQANKLREIEVCRSELQTDVGRKEAAIDDLNRDIDLHKGLLFDRDQQIQALMAEIEALYASRSWRITRPFRMAMRFFS
jgi:chromosome segregation ATPase